MVAAPDRASNPLVTEIPLDRIKVSTRLRATDKSKVTDIAESVEGVGLLHPISVSKKGEWFHLLDGMHRVESFRKLQRETIPATIRDADPLIEELIEVEGNLCSAKLTAIDEARFIVRWEEILSQLGRRAKQGDNRWKRSGLTNAELSKNRGMSVRTYQYTKSIEVESRSRRHLNETDFALGKWIWSSFPRERRSSTRGSKPSGNWKASTLKGVDFRPY